MNRIHEMITILSLPPVRSLYLICCCRFQALLDTDTPYNITKI